jgi:dipeptidyl aminopeptidase/acylaminoacyl peptidase
MSFAGSTDFNFVWTKQFGGIGPWDDPQHFLKMSPLTYLNRMKTPTLIDHQEEDHRCPIEQGEQLFAALKARDIPAEFLRYPGEPHGMSRGGRPDRKVDRMERIIAWLDRWLKKRGGGSRKP